MARKVFQDFAYVLCQKFIQLPSNRDLVCLLILGGGTLELDITAQKATINRYPVEPIPYAETARTWLNEQMVKHNIPLGELIRASLTIDYTVRQERKPDFPFPSAHFEFTCTGTIEASDRTYTARLEANKTWGLSTYF